MSFAHLRRHASLWLARLRELTRSQIKDLLSASGFQPSLESHFSCAVVLCSGLCVQIEDLRAASNRLCLFGLRLRRNRTPSGKVHELKARETSQEPLALGQMLGKNPRAGFSIFEQFSLLHLTACFQIYCLLEKKERVKSIA
ncbi:hypothetical protein [Methanocorpusculum sp. GPch4]|uniref:hypothetical protein n=1 Tax=Methanocorpusculum sp. GPch4 TaxID=2527877 RepID=UPI001432E032|nr:hypothetical protein [Methanocorpusculum sp. GPch4]